MDQCKIVPIIDEIKTELTKESAFFLPPNWENNGDIKEYMATEIDLLTYRLNDSIIKIELDRENLIIDNIISQVTGFFEYSINENTGIPVYIYEGVPLIKQSLSLSSLIEEDPKFEIIKRLNDPSCGHIIVDIRDIIRDLKNESLLIQEKMRRIQRFYKCTLANLEQHLLWRDIEEVEFTVDTLEDYVLKKCKTFVYGTDEGDKKNNEIFLGKNIAKEEEPTLDFLSLGKYKDFQELFDEMSQAKNAREIGDCVIAIHQHIADHQKEMNTDEILEKLEKIIRKCKPQTLVLDLLFLQRFHDHRHLENGQLSYCLTNMVYPEINDRWLLSTKS
jgi:hypothetical protein